MKDSAFFHPCNRGLGFKTHTVIHNESGSLARPGDRDGNSPVEQYPSDRRARRARCLGQIRDYVMTSIAANSFTRGQLGFYGGHLRDIIAHSIREKCFGFRRFQDVVLGNAGLGQVNNSVVF